jgi:hypothetical protein
VKLVAIRRAVGTRLLYAKVRRTGMGEKRDSLHAGIVLTCLDRAGNESRLSDTLWIDARAR